MRHLLLVITICTTLPAQAATYTYQCTGELTADSLLGPAGAEVITTFSYDTDLPVKSDMDTWVLYGSSTGQGMVPSFEIYIPETGIIIASSNYAKLYIANNHIYEDDTFCILGYRLTSPTLDIPQSINVGIILRDTSRSIFDSTAIPHQLPPLSSFSSGAIAMDGIPGLVSTITSLTWIPTGDLDRDGFVGITDLNHVLANWNQTVSTADPISDPSGDGFVGIEDLNIVLANWNAGTPPATSNVPEPGSVLMLTLGIAALAQHRVKR